jgi:hypothetical protein
MSAKIYFPKNSTVIIARVLTILYLGLTIFFDFFFGPDFLVAIPVKPRDVLLLVIFFWYLTDVKSSFWIYLWSILFKNWGAWSLRITVGWLFLVILAALFFSDHGNTSIERVWIFDEAKSWIFIFDALIVALAEGLIYKPLLLIAVNKWLGKWGFAFLSGALWSLVGLLHSGAFMMGLMIIFGGITALFFYDYKNLGFVIFLHFALLLI